MAIGLWEDISSGDSFSGSISFDYSAPNQAAGNRTMSRFLTGNLVLTIEGITFQLGSSFDERDILVTHSGAGEQWLLKNTDSPTGGSAATANGSVIDSLIQSLSALAGMALLARQRANGQTNQ